MLQQSDLLLLSVCRQSAIFAIHSKTLKAFVMKPILFSFLILLLTSCNNDHKEAASDDKIESGVEQVKEGVEMKADSVSAYLNAEKEKAEHRINDRISEIDAKLEELKKDGSEKAAATRKKLEDSKIELNKKLADIKESSAEAWEKTKKSADDLMDKADKEWAEFKSDFKKLFQ